MTLRQAKQTVKNKIDKKANNNHLAILLLFIGVLSIVLSLFYIENTDIMKISNKLFNVGLYTFIATMYKLLWYKKTFNTEKAISSDPRAIANDVGYYSIGLAIVLCF